MAGGGLWRHRKAKKHRKSAGPLLLVETRSRKIFTAGLDGHQYFLESGAWWGRFVCHKRQLQVVDDSVHHRELGEEGDDTHLALTFRTSERVDFIDFTDHLSPAAAGDPGVLVFDDDDELARCLRLAHLAPMSIGVEAELC